MVRLPPDQLQSLMAQFNLNDRVIAPSMGNFKPMREGYLLMMKDKLDTLPAGASVIRL